ncbi:uncharacterized protein LOC111111869 [Crassostrea virginica]
MVTTKEFSIIIKFCFLISFLLPVVKGCDIGYFGRLCDEKCRFPNYGLRCQFECNCSEKDCHHINGCGNFPSENFNTTVKTRMICKFTKRPFLFAIIGVTVVAPLISVFYTYITLCNDQRKEPIKMQLIV